MQPDMPQDEGSNDAYDDESGHSLPAANTTGDVEREVDKRIAREALRQLESIDFDDPNWRIDSLSAFPVNVEEVELEDPVDLDVD